MPLVFVSGAQASEMGEFQKKHTEIAGSSIEEPRALTLGRSPWAHVVSLPYFLLNDYLYYFGGLLATEIVSTATDNSKSNSGDYYTPHCICHRLHLNAH